MWQRGNGLVGSKPTSNAQKEKPQYKLDTSYIYSVSWYTLHDFWPINLQPCSHQKSSNNHQIRFKKETPNAKDKPNMPIRHSAFWWTWMTIQINIFELGSSCKQ